MTYVDAGCDYADARVLAQHDDDGHDRAVHAFASVKLSPSQRDHTEEAYAAVWALQKFSRCVFWSPVTILCTCRVVREALFHPSSF